MLSPWRSMWGAKNWDLFCLKNIVPKLKHGLSTRLLINPIDQNFDIIDSIITWHGNLNNRLYAQVFSTSFFPKFLKILKYWATRKPNLSELHLWIVGWKAFFPQDLLDQDVFFKHIAHSLQIVNSSKYEVIPKLPFVTSKSSNLRLETKKRPIFKNL